MVWRSYRLGKDVPIAPSVRPMTVSEMPSAQPIFSSARFIAYARSASHRIERKRVATYLRVGGAEAEAEGAAQQAACPIAGGGGRGAAHHSAATIRCNQMQPEAIRCNQD